MLTRLLGVLTILVVLLLGTLAVPAAAVESDHGPLPSSVEEVGTGSDLAREYWPQPAEEQPFTEYLVYPLLAVGVLAILGILALYLKWQPVFGAEERSRRR